MGYSDMNKKPFDPLTLVADGYDPVHNYIETNTQLHSIAIKTTEFLSGFYSDFALELLSTIDFLIEKHETFNKEFITNQLLTWSNRKYSMFSNQRYIDISIDHLQQYFSENTLING